MKDGKKPLRDSILGVGSHMNELDNRMEKDWQQLFCGENYGRLLGIKRAVDPEGVF